ncbi:MAG: hypothetical protein Kow0077_25220 [Anaerolineae bacterium]
MPPYEIVIVDNGGDAVFQHAPESVSAEIRLLRPEQNLGVTGGRNLGMARAQGEYLAVIDDDAVWLDASDVRTMVAFLEAHADYGAVAVKSLDAEGRIIDLELPFSNKRYARSLTEPTEAPYYIGVAHMLRAAALKQVGMYPERYFYAMEELDLSLRLMQAGFKIAYLPSVVVRHYRSRGGREMQVNTYWVRNAVNKSRLAWRLLPMPYPLTIMFIWSLNTLYRTRDIHAVLGMWRELWGERQLLARERHPIDAVTARRFRANRGRLLY